MGHGQAKCSLHKRRHRTPVGRSEMYSASGPATVYYNEIWIEMRRELLMGKVIVFTNLTLDGAMQAPGGRTRIAVAASSTAAGRRSTPRWQRPGKAWPIPVPCWRPPH